jgi:defect-in-organelle-trafficking protein DotC
MAKLIIFARMLAAASMASIAMSVYADDMPASLNKILNATAKSDAPSEIPEVRANALKEMGEGLGRRAGLADESKEIVKAVEAEKSILDTKFSFGSLTFNNGALPPVITEPRDIVSVMDYSMTIAGRVYKIISPARFTQVNWRDYLFLGLSYEEDPILNDEQRKLYPRNSSEEAYWKKVVTDGYSKGRKEAKQIFDINLARLKRDFNGMQLFYELYARGLVSAPVFASATQSVTRPDPNTIVIGESIFRITNQPAFDGNSEHWRSKK